MRINNETTFPPIALGRMLPISGRLGDWAILLQIKGLSSVFSHAREHCSRELAKLIGGVVNRLLISLD
jgi:hypothetical protein